MTVTSRELCGPLTLLAVFGLTGLAAGCAGGKGRTAECDNCPAGSACGDDDRCHPLCAGEKDCDLCSECRQGMCYPTASPTACECSSAAECDDGDPCNGAERCVDEGDAEKCRPGPDYVCPTPSDPCERAICQANGLLPECVNVRLTTPECQCQPATAAELCARDALACGAATVTDNCGETRAIDCGACTSGGSCDAPTNRCLCLGIGYGGDWTTDGGDPATDMIVNDSTVTGGTCLTVADESRCVSLPGRQEALLGVTPDAAAILVMRGSPCTGDRVWLYEGSLATGQYTGTDLTDLLVGQTPAWLLAEEQLTLTPDGLTIIGVSADQQGLQATSRSAVGLSDFAVPTAAWFGRVNSLIFEAGMAFWDPAISNDGRSLFFRFTGYADGHYEAQRASAGEVFDAPARLDGAINDGTYWKVSGATADRLTLYVLKDWTTFVFFRATVGGTPALQSIYGVPGFRLRPIDGCARLFGSVAAAGGCANEEIGWAVENW